MMIDKDRVERIRYEGVSVVMKEFLVARRVGF
jgi:hypothetical protein